MTRDLLIYKCASGRIKPCFLKFDSDVAATAELLLSIYVNAVREKWSRAVLNENLEPLLKGAGNSKIPLGMNKILSDHCEFSENGDSRDWPQLRKFIFEQSAAILAQPPASEEEYRRTIMRNLSGKISPLPEDLYGDLPEFDCLEKIPEWSAVEFCNMYNIALVQGLLLYADKLELTAADTNAMTLRKFMRRLKFYRLLAEVEKSSIHEVKLTISGPGSVLGENRKYGFQLAAFFPVILLLKNWKLRAEVKIRQDSKNCKLKLDSEQCILKSSVRRWAECVPEEVAMFIRAFRKNNDLWQEAPEAEFPRIAGCGAFFPDFSFEKKQAPGQVVHVELFHRFYRSTLENRLDFLLKNPRFPLLVGIDRSALGRDGEKALQEKYESLADQMFFFSGYPGSERMSKMLDKTYSRSYGSLGLE